MSQDDVISTGRYAVYCRECDWRADGPVELKGTANLLAGRHISRTDHVVAVDSLDQPADDADDSSSTAMSVR